MKTCPNCQHQQSAGNFCGKCGTPLSEATAAQPSTLDKASAEQTATAQFTAPKPETIQSQTSEAGATAQPNEQLEKLKSGSKQFFSFFTAQLKTPSAYFHLATDSGFKNGLLSIVVYIILAAMSGFFLIRSIAGSSFSYVGVSFMDVIMPLILFSILAISVNLAAIYVTAKLFSNSLTFKDVIQKTGGFYAVPIALTAVGLLLILIKSYTISFSILAIGAGIAFGTIPMFVMISLLARNSKSVDKFYAFLFYIAFVSIAGMIIGLLIMDSQIGDLIDSFNMYNSFY